MHSVKVELASAEAGQFLILLMESINWLIFSTKHAFFPRLKMDPLGQLHPSAVDEIVDPDGQAEHESLDLLKY